MERARNLKLQIASDKIVIPFFNRPYYLSQRGILDTAGKEPTPAVGAVLLEYVLRNETIHPPARDKISFRDIEGAGPLVASFASNTNRLIAQTFARRLPDLEAACLNIKGEHAKNDMSADLSMRFTALPEVMLYLTFNDKDEDFPSQCHLLFYRSAEQYLSMKSLFVLGTSLAGSLIKFLQEGK